MLLNALGGDNWSGYWTAKDFYTDNQDVDYEDMALEDLKNEFENMETEVEGKF